MGKFACIIHPLDLQLAATYEPGLLHKSEPICRKILEWAPPFCVSRVSGLRSAVGEEIVGNLVLCPLLPDQLLQLNETLVVDRLVKAGRLAEQAGANIVGLEAYTAIPGKRGVEVSKRLNIPVTTGSSYTVAIAVEAIQAASELLGLDLSKVKTALVGATGTLGRVCSEILADLVGNLVLVARNADRLKILAQALLDNKHKSQISWCSDVLSGVGDADLIVTATSTPETIIEAEFLKPGALVFDLSRPRNVSGRVAKLRKDVLVIDGGVVQTPGPINFNFNFGLPIGLVYACMAETMALALEGRYESFSIGGNITAEKVREIHAIAKKHGFHLAAMRSFDQPVLQTQIDRVREAHERQHSVTRTIQ